jgi:hypothetical protein
VSITQQQIDAAQEFVNATVDALRTDQGVHAETAVAGAARMAGTFLFHSFGFSIEDIQPGQVVLSDQANEQGPVLIGILEAVLSQMGVGLDVQEVGNTVDEEIQPNLSFLETQRRLEPKYSAIREHYGLSLQEAAEACAVATAMLIQMSSMVLDPNAAFDLAVYGFIEGTKTAPDQISS